MMRIEDQLSEERLKSAVNASAAPVPESFIWNTEQMIDRLPRKERYIVRNKLSVGLVLTIILCMLTVTAVAAALLTGWELVEQEVLPMALENDSGSAAPLIFTNEELQYIAALAEENGVTLGENVMLALENGLDVLEKEVFLDLAYSDFGPVPMQWTLEEQYWFGEAMVKLGLQKQNPHLLPGEGDLTEEEALRFALAHATRQPDDDRKAYLSDPAAYTLHRSYQMSYNHIDGTPTSPMWLFGFLEKDGPSYYQVLMDQQGGYIGVMWEDTTEYEGVNAAFSHEELARIAALAEENGIVLKDSILRALEKGEGYWEEEVIMDLAKSQFGPYPGQWTLEEQYWFEETLITIGFQDYNQCRVPGEGELTYEEACAKAIGYFMDEGWLTDPSILEDRTKYSLWRSYLAERLEDGSSADPMWHFQFAPRDINLPTLSVTMDHRGEVDGIGRMPGLEEQLAAGTLRWYEVQDRFTDVYGSLPTWTPEVFVAYVDALGRSDLTNISKGTQAYLNTKYILPPEGALTSDQATEISLARLNPDSSGEIRIGGIYCFEVDGRALWKVTIALNSSRISDMVELDCMTGEIVHMYKTDDEGGAVQFYVPKVVRDAIPTPNPEGNG